MSFASLWPEDPALPQLPQVLDEHAMSRAFGELLQAHGTRVEQCRLERIKYRPGRNCTLSYLLHLRRRDSGSVFTQHVAARLCSGGEAARRHAAESATTPQPSPAGPGRALLPALDMLTWWWPNDPKLAAPRVLADPRRLREQVLPEVVAALGAGGGTLVDHQLEVAQYVPEQRLTARVDLHWAAAGQAYRQRVFAKAGREPGGAAAHAVLRALQQSPAWRAGRLRTPAAVLWQPETELHWQLGVPGQAWLDLPATPSARLAGALGAQLAALHGTPVEAAGVLNVDTLTQRLDDVSTTLHAALPAARRNIAEAAARLVPGLRWLHGAPMATLHGDLHPRNVLADGADLFLVDLDALHRGPALLELGGWVADGICRAVLEGADPMRDAPQWQALLDGYASAGGQAPSGPALAWASAWMLLTQRAWRCVVNLKPGRFAIAPALVALAARLADTARLERP